MKCSHFAILQLVFVFASCQQYGDLRLDIDHRHDGSGILQIYLGRWMPVCYEEFDKAAAITACRQLGYAKDDGFQLDDVNRNNMDSGSYITQCPIQGDYINHGLLHILRCHGYTQQASCSQGGIHLYCIGSSFDNPYNGQVILNTTGYYNSSGVLTLYYNNKWLPVCCENYNNPDDFAVDSACRQLGYTGGSSINSHLTRVSTWNIGDSNGVTCDKSYSCLKNCSNKDPVPISCQPCNITCVYNTSVEKIYSSGSKTECMIDGDNVYFQSTIALVVIAAVAIIVIIVMTVALITTCIKKRNHGKHDLPGGDHLVGDHLGGDHLVGDHPGGDRPGGDHPGGDHPGGDHPGGDRPGGEHPGRDHPGGERPGRDHPGGEHPGRDHPGGDHPGRDHPGGDHPGGDRPGGDHPGHDHPDGDRPGRDSPGGDRPGRDSPGGDRPGHDNVGDGQM